MIQNKCTFKIITRYQLLFVSYKNEWFKQFLRSISTIISSDTGQFNQIIIIIKILFKMGQNQNPKTRIVPCSYRLVDIVACLNISSASKLIKNDICIEEVDDRWTADKNLSITCQMTYVVSHKRKS